MTQDTLTISRSPLQFITRHDPGYAKYVFSAWLQLHRYVRTNHLSLPICATVLTAQPAFRLVIPFSSQLSHWRQSNNQLMLTVTLIPDLSPARYPAQGSPAGSLDCLHEGVSAAIRSLSVPPSVRLDHAHAPSRHVCLVQSAAVDGLISIMSGTRWGFLPCKVSKQQGGHACRCIWVPPGPHSDSIRCDPLDAMGLPSGTSVESHRPSPFEAHTYPIKCTTEWYTRGR